MKLGIKDGLKHIFYIELEISGDSINTFFNMCRKKDIIFFDVQHIKAGIFVSRKLSFLKIQCRKKPVRSAGNGRWLAT